MTTIVLYEDEGYANLLPLVWWRTVFELRVGRKIILDRTAQALGSPIAGVWTRDWMAPVADQRCGAPANRPIEAGTVLVNGRWLVERDMSLPDPPCVGVIDEEVVFIACDADLAGRLTPGVLLDVSRRADALEDIERIDAPGLLIRYPWDIIAHLETLVPWGWEAANAAVGTAPLVGDHVGPRDRIHIGQSTRVHPTAVIDASNGPIFISHDVSVGPYAIIEGPAYIGPGSTVHAHAWLRDGNAIGPMCKVGGEIEQCVFVGYSNKQHAGFLGHSYVGAWVNIGAGAVNSDLKNTYGNVRVPVNGALIDTGLTFFGAIIADHAKIGINATIPTGASVGMAATIVTGRVLPKNIPSFAWVTEDGIKSGDPGHLLDVATRVMHRRNIDMTDEEVELFLDLGARAKARRVG